MVSANVFIQNGGLNMVTRKRRSKLTKSKGFNIMGKHDGWIRRVRNKNFYSQVYKIF